MVFLPPYLVSGKYPMGVVSDNGVGLFDGYYQGDLHENNVE